MAVIPADSWGTSQKIALAPPLRARFYALRYQSDSIGFEIDPSEDVVEAAVLDVPTRSGQANWQSPFEHMGPESRASALVALAQSGALANIADAVANNRGIGQKLSEFARNARGQTGFTRTNSLQTFNGSAPDKLSLNILFRAWSDPIAEVETPKNRLWEWFRPQFLADTGFLSNLASGTPNQSGAAFFLPSKVPKIIGLHFRGETLYPMVIESIEESFGPLHHATKRPSYCQMQVVVASMEGSGRDDVRRLMSYQNEFVIKPRPPSNPQSALNTDGIIAPSATSESWKDGQGRTGSGIGGGGGGR